MKEYNMEERRLNYYLRDQRDNWKERAKIAQNKKIRVEAKLEYTTHSRDRWKNKAKKAQDEVKVLQALLKQKDREIEQLKKNLSQP